MNYPLLFMIVFIILAVVIMVRHKSRREYDTIEEFFYYKSQNSLRDTKLRVIRPKSLIQLPSPFTPYGHYKFFNPSIQFWNGELWYSLRFCNWTYCHPDSFKDNYKHPTPGKSELYITNQKTSLRFPMHDKLDDCRIFSLGKSLYVLGNEPIRRKRTINLYSIDVPKVPDHSTSLDSYFKAIVILQPDDVPQKKVEKNWTPLVIQDTDELLVLRTLNPAWLYKVDVNTGICKVVSKKYNDRVSGMLRGGSQLRHWSGGLYLGVAHMTQSNKAYSSLFYIWDHPGKAITRVSVPFLIENTSPIQFVAGLELLGEFVYVTYGENDCRAMQFKLARSQVWDMLHKI